MSCAANPDRPRRARALLLAALSAAALMAPRPGRAGDGRERPPHESLSVAAAANLVYALDALDAAFQKANAGVELTRQTGASGSLVAQIVNGAPYDLFLSADADYPRRLADRGGADRASLAVFAYGRLVLWTTRPSLEPASLASVVRDPSVARIAIANPDIAPYGRAARQALERLGLMTEAGTKLVMGESVAQAAQFVETGNADAGLVALSLVLSPRLRERGRWIEVPRTLYEPIEQAAILTNRGAANPAARRYLAFLAGGGARKILEDFGYGVPPSP